MAMEVKFVVASGKSAGQKIAVPGPKFFIGRAEDCNLRPQSDLISRHHCVILVEDGYVAVRDFGSKNGTFVNGNRVRSEQELKSGDTLKVGPLEFSVELTVPVGAKKRPKVQSVQEAAARTAEAGVAGTPGEAEEQFDLNNWFGDDADVDTHTDTKTIDMIKPETIAPQPKPAESPSEPKKKPTAKPAGALPKKQADSSRAAAEEMLKQLFRRP